MILVTQPPFLFPHKKSLGGQQASKTFKELLPGLLAAIFSAITAAAVNITITKLKSEDSSIITLYAMLGSIVVALPGFFYHQVGPDGEHNLWHSQGEVITQLCLTGLLSWTAQMLKTKGVQMSKTLGVLVMRYLDIFFSFTWDIVFLHSTMDGLSYGGAAIVVGGCLVSILAKRRR